MKGKCALLWKSVALMESTINLSGHIGNKGLTGEKKD